MAPQLFALGSQHPSFCTTATLRAAGPSPSPRLMISMALTVPPSREAKGTTTARSSAAGGVEMKQTLVEPPQSKPQIAAHSLPPEKLEIFRSMEGWVEENILTFLKPVESSWQPHDFLPDPSLGMDSFVEGVWGIRERAAEIPDDYLVCLAGNMITEEALPTYQSVFNTFDGVRDESGTSPSPWARWTRKWSAEENRHGDLLNKYLYLTGRLDMRKVEMTIQYLIGSGMIIGTENNPFMGFVYTSFQERATFISHGNTARHAKEHGDVTLAKICGAIAADEKRHEKAYTKITEKLFEIDPDTAMQALARMMRHRIVMPASLAFDGEDRHLFDHYSSVAQRVGVYTTRDYIENLEFFIRRWSVENITAGLSAEGRRAQDYVCGLPPRMRKMEERAQLEKPKKQTSQVPFSWIFNRSVDVV